MTLGQRLRAIRDARGLNQDQFAVILGTTRGGVCNLEKDRRDLTLNKVLKIAADLDCDPHDLDPRLCSPSHAH